ncbi:hypothetical protein RJ639_003227 [Escallonia herrerae]|uniref:Disease resistance R13L4/SHOC-2-like LRR domain-containing protein n=1 Tax=Escallonia herrerae TaxID=1293975 RepID=A0AA88W098_9ASTE|nr:hypothetical protein RJ639_003227 [Escallonia herrerae]
MDLQDVAVEKLPDEIADLFDLRYLNLRRTKVKELPKSIGKLQNLQTLDIADSNIEVLPKSIRKLQKLRHLIVYRYYPDGDDFYYIYGTPLPSSICKLANLQVLTGVDAKPCLLKRLKNMTQLTSLAITKVRKVDEDLCSSIQRDNHREGVMPGLQQMYLGNCMELKMLPRGIENLTSLAKLDLLLLSKELIDRIRGVDSVDYPRVRHIPEIDHFYQSTYGQSYESLSRLDFKKVTTITTKQ